ncbi:protein kinase domain-containing protein [Sorangium sp. So ce124]|uniref:protein kinase domain-containing protein n=1 Tax=Sorangium sp. So ce124 TaxID=3133280 RepID=UPI003F6031D8
MAEQLPVEYIEPFRSRGFELKAKIGSGLSGTVFRAHQASLDRDVAVKVFDNPIATKSAALRKRFEREARLLGRVSHPSLPVVLTRGELNLGQRTVPYTVMEFIDAETLEDVIKRDRRLDISRAVAYASHVLGALSAAHLAKIVHRDVKPANILVQSTGHVYLIDFSVGVSLEGGAGLTRVTAEGQGGRVGSWDYMPPEQHAGGEADPRSDLYATGVILFEMLAGHNRINVDTLDKDLPGVAAPMRAVIKKACQSKLDERYESANAFRRALKRFEISTIVPEQPSTALCTNTKCEAAQWTERGYYGAPCVIADTTDSFCKKCGNQLTYPCEGCGRPFGGDQFCGSCGRKHYDVPLCKQCGSWLMLQDMDIDTGEKGCQKCRRKAAAATRYSRPVSASPPPAEDDDIPF